MAKYPNVKVTLVGENGNAFAILGRVVEAMRQAKVDPTEVKQFMEEATSGNYDNLLITCMKWVNCR